MPVRHRWIQTHGRRRATPEDVLVLGAERLILKMGLRYECRQCFLERTIETGCRQEERRVDHLLVPRVPIDPHAVTAQKSWPFIASCIRHDGVVFQPEV